MPACKFMKKTLLHILFHVFCLHFLRIHHDYFFRRVCEYNFFQRKVVLLVIYLFNHDSSKSTIFMLNMSFDVLLSTVFVKLESFVSWNIKHFALCFDIYFFLLKLIILTHGHNSFLFWHLYQIQTFNNNLNEEGMITSHLMCANFFMIKMLL